MMLSYRTVPPLGATRPDVPVLIFAIVQVQVEGATGVPCLYFLMGAQLSEESSRHHHPRFDFDEACLAPTAALLCALAERLG